MAYYKKTTQFKKILYSRGMTLVIIILVLFMGYSVFSVASKSIEAAKARKISEAQAAELQAKEANLSKKLDLLATPEGKEAALREQFPVVAPGEHVVVITEDHSTSASSAAALKKSSGFWNFLKNLFTKK